MRAAEKKRGGNLNFFFGAWGSLWVSFGWCKSLIHLRWLQAIAKAAPSPFLIGPLPKVDCKRKKGSSSNSERRIEEKRIGVEAVALVERGAASLGRSSPSVVGVVPLPISSDLSLFKFFFFKPLFVICERKKGSNSNSESRRGEAWRQRC